ncbi:gephyrin-like molybdotransferase Glp [Thermomonas sp.]|uniref:molybdopterin molybdotransferase MoeA n=1 Tax=Thermomonas sp. TaxID=1971895 RepID=UPI00238F3511|nr:gephyrin-like molybdotransferase Glp [Thermomonas sp.]MBS0460634.1 molybdopterin molybdotransferase MoeA [Pseudomonadota bacterium]MDE2381536.1 molybdopterin molybdotransferase MoeA [Xanthomonadaceae bacterium]HOC10493.1 molybdopterin molybdotransferase MoeA [Thermomonas sp.]HQA01890.1 molybdopterin molybdotransferase MoeA [Thermomonas sp.]
MIGFDEALALIQREVAVLPARTCAAPDAVGLVLASDVCSGEDLPPFDNSAMDGFALRIGSEPLAVGAELDVAGAQAAGDTHAIATSGAWEIMTGARLPDGLDAVIPVEQVEVLVRDGTDRPLRIRTTAVVEPGQHVRLRGEDVRTGACILKAGTRIEAPQLMLLAALGVAQVQVRPAPRVALLTTGRELVDDPTRTLASGEIRNSNGPYLAQRVRDAGAQLVLRETVSDDADAFLAALQRALAAGAEVVLSTGAVSMGRYDFVPDALRRIGACLHFHKVRIRPGKPLLFASLPGGQLYFGLPGNPVSSAVGLRFFVEPALRVLLGLAPERALRVPLAAAFNKRAALRFHLKGGLELDQHGQLQARVLPGQESFRIAPMAQANCWIVLPDTAASPAAGAMVDVYGLGHWLPPQLDEVMT